MKNKKSKFVVPALVLIGLSTAASVSGSVAWFTAARNTTVKTGTFAVVKTGDDLAVSLNAVAGVAIDNKTVNPATYSTSNYKLTDASFDHTYHNTEGWAPYVVTPNVPRTDVLSTAKLSSAQLQTDLGRGNGVLSAFVWTMTFTIDFAPAETYNQGLFLDLQDTATYMSVPVPVQANQSITGLYDNPERTGNPGDQNAKAAAAGTYYRAPTSSGKGFRIAFVPSTVPSGSKGYAKVWADNETSVSGEGTYVDNIADRSSEQGDSRLAKQTLGYSNATIVNAGSGYITATAGATAQAQKVYMKSGDTTVVPNDNATDLDDAHAKDAFSNYLGYFGCPAANATGDARKISLTFTCVAWYEGSHPEVDSDPGTVLEEITTSMRFAVRNLNDHI